MVHYRPYRDSPRWTFTHNSCSLLKLVLRLSLTIIVSLLQYSTYTLDNLDMHVPKRLFPERHDPQKTQITQNLLRDIWSFSLPHTVPSAKAASCFYHYQNLLTNPYLLDDQNTSLRESDTQSSDIITLVGSLKQDLQKTITATDTSLETNPPTWLLNPQSQVARDRVLTFAVLLWLFVKPDLSDGSVTLQDAVRKPLNAIAAQSSTSWIWLDFSAHTLAQRAGFRIMWTSDLCEHLTFASKSVIRVFSHASVLEQYEGTSEG